MDKKQTDALCEDLLSSWLSISATVRNERMVKAMTFREIFICNILMREAMRTLGGATIPEEEQITATDIVNETGMLKSQANKVLTTMEDNGYIIRQRSENDKRKVFIHLTKKGIDSYKKEHEGILVILRQLIDKVGAKRTSAFINELNFISSSLSSLDDN